MIVGSIKENTTLEKRVSLTPESAKNIIGLGLKVCVEKGYAKNIDIHYNTNGTQLPPQEIFDLWSYFKHVEVAFSIDDVGQAFEYQRHPAKWREVNQNLIINPVYSIFIPSSFTPNADDKNEVFKPVINAAQSYIMKIYDRWGGIIYQAENQGWDGKNVPSGQYFYSIDIIDFKNKIEREVGQITLTK